MIKDMNVMNVIISENNNTGKIRSSSLKSAQPPAVTPVVMNSLQSCPQLANFTCYTMSPPVLLTHFLTTCNALGHHLLKNQPKPSTLANYALISDHHPQSLGQSSSLPTSAAVFLSLLNNSSDSSTAQLPHSLLH
jgi:hypothetical protein